MLKDWFLVMSAIKRELEDQFVGKFIVKRVIKMFAWGWGIQLSMYSSFMCVRWSPASM